jgi:hypothetical protein
MLWTGDLAGYCFRTWLSWADYRSHLKCILSCESNPKKEVCL